MIKVIQNEDKSYDLFDSKTQVKITNESFKYIKGTRHFFIVTKHSKHGVYNRKGVLLENCDYLDYQITMYSKSLILNKTIGISKNTEHILLSKEKKCSGFFSEIDEIPDRLEDNSYSFVLSFGEYPDSCVRLWNTKFGFCQINFKEIEGFINGASLAKTSDGFGIIDIKGKWIEGYENLRYDDYSENWGSYRNCVKYQTGLLPFEQNGFYGLINYKNNLLFEPISTCPIIFFTKYNSTDKKFAQVTINGLSGIIDNQLNWIIEPIYEDFKDAFTYYYYQRYEIADKGNPYIVKSTESNKYGLLSYDGKWLCQPIYDEIKQRFVRGFVNSDEQYLIFKIDNMEGVIDRNGKELLRGEFEICWLSDYSTDDHPDIINNWWETTQFLDECLNCCVLVNGLKGLVNKRGNWVLKPKYEQIEGFHKRSDRYISADGEEIEIMEMGRFGEKNRCKVHLNGQIMIVDKKGKVIEYLP